MFRRRKLEMDEFTLLHQLLCDHIRQLNNLIRESDALSNPVSDGHWRWADVKPGGYGRKSADELAADRYRARLRAQNYRAQKVVALAALAKLSGL